MADVDSVLDSLGKLKVAELEEDWVKSVWDSDFTDTDPLPIATSDEFESADDHRSNLQSLRASLAPWLDGLEETGFWATLIENDVSHRSLVAFLHHIIEAGQLRTATASKRGAGMLAAEVYFCLLTLPGSGAFKIFHPMLFQRAVDTFKIWTKLDAPPKKRKGAPAKTAKASRGQKGRKRARREEPEETENPFGDEEEEEEEDGEMTPKEVAALHKALRSLLKAFVRLLEAYSLKDNEQSTIECIQVLTTLVRVEPETFHGNFDSNSLRLACVVPQLAYKGLIHLCTSTRGATATIVSMVFKFLLPHLLMMGENKGVCAATIPQNMQLIKNHALSFVLHLLENFGEPIRAPTRVLLQHMCVKVPDKAEYRNRVSPAVVAVLRRLSTPSYARMVAWIYKFSRNAKIGYRSFALSLVIEMIAEPERAPEATMEPEYVSLLSHQFLVQMILARCSDIAPTVRARAIQSFASCCSATQPLTQTAIKTLVTPRPTGGRGPISRVVATPDPTRAAAVTEQNKENESVEKTMENLEAPKVPDDVANVTPQDAENPALAPVETPLVFPTPGGIILTPGGEISIIEGKGVVSMLHRRTQHDDRANVRKAAVQALENLIRLDGTLLNSEDLSVLNKRCNDPSLSVRRQALRSLTDLLNNMPLNSSLQRSWMDGVLPLVMDRETSCQEKCIEAIDEIILSNIVPHQRSKNERHQMAWQMLAFLATPEAVDLRRYVQKMCQQLGRSGKLQSSLPTYLATHVGTENNTAVWMLLACLVPFAKISHGFVVDYWTNTAREAGEGDSDTVHRVLVIIGYIAKNIGNEKSVSIADDLKSRLMNFDSPPELIAVTVNTLGKLCRAQSGGDEAACKRVMDKYLTDLLQACDSYLSRVILNETADMPVDEEKTICHIFTLGEIAQLCPNQTPKRASMLIQSLVASPVINTIDGSTQMPSTQCTSTQSNPSEDPSQQTSRPKSTSPGEWSRATSLGYSQASQAPQTQLSQFRGSRMSSRVRAFAFTTLGKLCLQNEDLAKKVVAALARELEVATDQAIRNNVVIILCDLCVRYTSVVDRYISNISACLKDDSPIIRKQTLTLITHLLQEDFLKWKGSLFFRFIMTLVDEYKEIREFSEFCLIHVLMQRHPGMFANHFIECIFHFNSYDGHHAFNKFAQTDQQKQKFSMKGKALAPKRQKIYLFLLENLTDEQRFALTAKLTQEVLGAAVDDTMPINADTSALIQDTLFILASKEIKLAAIRAPAGDEDAVEPADMAAAVMNVAKKTLITQVMKKNVIENIVPTVIGLKHKLETYHSPLLKDLMMYLRELVKDYKTEVKDIMSADRQLANEIEFDLRKFEEQQEEEARRRQQLPGPGGTPVGSPLIRGSPVISPGGRAASPAGRPMSPVGHPGSPKTPSRDTMESVPSDVGTPPPAKSLAKNLAMKLAKAATPLPNNRRTSMSTLAIMNSARKAMEKARRVSSTDGGLHPKRVVWADEGNPTSKQLTKEIDSSASSDAASPGFRTPRQHRGRPRISRAISTPAANLSVLGDLTFQQGDLSLIPGTPTHDNSPSSGDKEAERDVIHMMSPDKPRPKPRTWNIKSPADPVKVRLMPSDESDAAETSEPLKADSKKTTREVLVPKRSTRVQTRRSQQVEPPSDTENESFVSLSESASQRRSSTKRSAKVRSQQGAPPSETENESSGSQRRSSSKSSARVQTRRSQQGAPPSDTENESFVSLSESGSRRRSSRRK